MKETTRLPKPYTSECLDNWDSFQFYPEDSVYDLTAEETVLTYIANNETSGYSYPVMKQRLFLSIIIYMYMYTIKTTD
jgi:hypothetical protein